MKKDNRRFKISWYDYPGNPKPETHDISYFNDGMGFNKDHTEAIDALDVGEVWENGGPHDSVKVKRLADVTESLLSADRVRKIAGLPSIAETALDKFPAAKEVLDRVYKIADEIGAKCGVDFTDADGDAARKAIINAYTRGFSEGRKAEKEGK